MPGALVVAVDAAWVQRGSRRAPDRPGLPYDVVLTAPGAVRDDVLGARARDAVVTIAVEALARAHTAGRAAPSGILGRVRSDGGRGPGT